MDYPLVPMYQNATFDGVDYFAITAYFVDPGINIKIMIIFLN